MDEGGEFLSEEGLWNRMEAKRVVAQLMKDSEAHCREAWMAAGFGAEFALKAVIMRKRRLNSWPNYKENPKLHTHDLRRLIAEAEIDLGAIDKSLRAAFRVVMDWERHHDYNDSRMSIHVVRDMVEAVFGKNGVVEWMKTIK